MHPHELWRHRATGRVVRIERCRGGFLSISVWTALLKGGRWGGEFRMVNTLWDDAEFKQKFELVYRDHRL